MMSKSFLFLVGLLVIISLCLVDGAQNKGKKWRKKKKGESKEAGLKEEVDKLRTDLAELRAKIEHAHHSHASHGDDHVGDDHAGDAAVSTCGSNKVHFYFQGHNHAHGDDGEDHHHDDDDVHVHVDLRLDDSYHGGDHDHTHTGSCVLDNGYAYIIQNAGDKYANFKFTFEDIAQESFDLHVHANGDLRNGCKGLGAHHDPFDKDIDIGDLGTIRPAIDDIDEIWFNNTKLSLTGPHSIIGLSIIGHDGKNGDRVTCCVIGRGADDHSHDSHGHKSHDHASHGHDHDHHGDDHHYGDDH